MIGKWAKVFLIACLSSALAYLSDIVSEPPPSLELIKYQEFYNSRPSLMTEDEFDELRRKEKELMSELSSSKSIQQSAQWIFKMKAIFVPLICAFWFFCAKKYGISDNFYLLITVAAIVLPALLFVNVIESSLYGVMFFLGNLYRIKGVRLTAVP